MSQTLHDAAAPPRDLLAAALLHVARHHGLAGSIEAATAGLPLVEGRLPLTHIALAAERLGLLSAQRRIRASTIRAEDCPLLLVLKNGDIAIVSGRNGKKLTVLLMSRGSAQELGLRDLSRLMTGEAVMLAPRPDSLDSEASMPTKTARTWLLDGFAGARGALLTAAFATILINIAALAIPMFTMNIYDRVIPNAAMNTLWALTIGAALLIGFDFMMRSLRAEIIDITGRRVDVRLSNSLFAQLLGAKPSHQPQSAGARVATLKDFESLREFFQSVTITTLGDIPFAIVFIAAVYILAGPLALTLLIAAPLTLATCMLIQLRLRSLLAAEHREQLLRHSVATETIVGIETIKALAAESWAAEKWERATADGIRQAVKIRRATNLASHIVIAAQLLVTVVMVVHGVYLATEGVITAGALIASVMLAGRAMSPVGQAALLLTRIGQTRIAFESLRGVIEAEQERGNRRFVRKPSIAGTIAFEGVTFRYAEDTPPALNAVSCAIREGERIGILGSIGSGKSTALRAIVNLVTPQQGRIFVDGVAATHLDPTVLRRSIALVGQEAMLFRGTLRQNITIHQPFADDEAVLDALRRAGADAFVSRLPKGLDTMIGERGQGLSGGQRQAIALARCFVGKPRVLLLDEPTGAMDGKTESALLATLADYAAETGATLIIVTHRPAVLEIVDRLMVFDAGRLTLDGPKASVLQALKAQSARRTMPIPPAAETGTGPKEIAA